jgi:hypothetical protein
VIFTAGCGGPELRRFNHSFHRVNYNITDPELRELQFYTSDDVLIKVVEAGPAGGAPVRADRVFVTRGTPGQVVDTGPNWLRISFSEGGTGVFFVANPADPLDDYHLGRQEPNGELRQFKQVSDTKFVHEGTTYEVIYGERSYISVDAEHLQAIIARRKTVEGRVVPPPEEK